MAKRKAGESAARGRSVTTAKPPENRVATTDPCETRRLPRGSSRELARRLFGADEGGTIGERPTCCVRASGVFTATSVSTHYAASSRGAWDMWS